MNTLIETHRAALTQLCRRHHVRRLDLFGSAATGAFDADTSDLDFIVEFAPMDPVLYKRSFFDLLAGSMPCSDGVSIW